MQAPNALDRKDTRTEHNTPTAKTPQQDFEDRTGADTLRFRDPRLRAEGQNRLSSGFQGPLNGVISEEQEMSTSRQVSLFIQLRDSDSTLSARQGWGRLTEGTDDKAMKSLALQGVDFDASGNVIRLDLSESRITGKLRKSRVIKRSTLYPVASMLHSLKMHARRSA